MVYIIIQALAILLLAFSIYYFYIKPKRLIAFYKKALEPNFKVLVYPFAPLYASEFSQYYKDQKKHKDAFWYLKQVASSFDVSIINIADKVGLNLISPRLMQAYYEVDQQKYYQKCQNLVSVARRIIGKGIFLTRGQVWKTKRRIATKMLNFSYIKLLVSQIHVIVKNKSKQLIDKCEKQEDGFAQIDVFQLTTQIASTVMLQLFFGGAGQYDVNNVKINGKTINWYIRRFSVLMQKQLFTEPHTMVLGESYCKLGVTKLDRQINEIIKISKEFAKYHIERRLQQLKRSYQNGKQFPEIYTDLIEAYYVEEVIKRKVTITAQFIQLLIDQFANIYSAGTDTTSRNGLSALYFAFSNPNIKQKLQTQISSKIQDFTQLSYQSLKNCTYLQAFLTETLRMYSVFNGMFPRQALQDHQLTVGNVKIPIKKGTIINTQTIPVHFNQTIYKNPQEFNPQRFIDKEGKFINPQPFTLMNFSAGPRNCFGKQLAMTELRIMLATFINFFDIKVNDSEKVFAYKEFTYNLQNVKFLIKPKQM